jgi:RNA polymerase sigma factor (sigma-70 family)
MDPGEERFPAGSPATDSREQSALGQGPDPVPLLKPEQLTAFIDFYRDDIERLVTFLRWYGADLAEAADIAQEAMTKAFYCWERLTKPSAWVRCVASRMFIRRRTHSVEDVTDQVPEPQVALIRDDIPAEALEDQDGQLVVLRALAMLPSRQRQVMAWTYDGYSPAEIAVQLSAKDHPLKPEAVRASLKLARRALAAHLGLGKDQP